KTVKLVMPVEIDYAAIAEKTTVEFADFVKEGLNQSLKFYFSEISAVSVDDFKGYYSIGVKVELPSGISIHKFNYYYDTNSKSHDYFGASEITMLQELLASDPS